MGLIAYPVTLPATPGARIVTWKPQDARAVTVSPYDGSQQTEVFPPPPNLVEIQYPPMDRAEAEELLAKLLSCHFDEGTFLFGDTIGATARGAVKNYQTNLLTWSDEFQRSDWTKQSAVVTPHALNDGGVLMAKLERLGASSNPQVSEKKNAAPGDVWTASVEAKEGTTGIDVDFTIIWRNSANGTISTVTSSIFDVTATRTRFSHTFAAAPAGAATGELFIRARNTASDGQFVYIARAQLEKASAFSSYLATGGAVAHSDIARDHLLFDGVDDYVSIPHNAAYNSATASWEFWWRAPTAAPSALKHLVQKGTTQTDREFLFYQQNGTGKLVLSFGTGSIFEDSPTADGYIDGKWHHVMGTKSGTSIRMYVDGVQVVAATLSATPVTGTANILVANSTAGASSNASAGPMCEFRMWNTERTLTQIRDNLAKQLVGNESGLVGYWRFDERTGTSLDDLTTTNNNGTVSGAAWSQLPEHEALVANLAAPLTDAVKAGDWLQFPTYHLHKVLAAASANAGGVAHVAMHPTLRETPADQAAIVVASTQGAFRLVGDDSPAWTIDQALMYGIQIAAMEAF